MFTIQGQVLSSDVQWDDYTDKNGEVHKSYTTTLLSWDYPRRVNTREKLNLEKWEEVIIPVLIFNGIKSIFITFDKSRKIIKD